MLKTTHPVPPIQHSPGIECNFSFADLFIAAEGRTWTSDEEIVFKNLTQRQRNEWVSSLVVKAPEYVTQDKVGTGGVMYRAFWIP
jgi:hypothetical protein